MPMDKRCPRCKQVKPVEAFSHHRGQADGLAVHCRVCKGEIEAAWRTANPRKHALRIQRWRDRHPETYRQQNRDASARLRERQRAAAGAA